METDFAERGFVVIKPSWLAKHLTDVQSEPRSTVRSFPEFRSHGVWGVRRDGVLTNPGSFHNLLSRQLRQCATSEIAPIIIDLLQQHPDFDMQCVLAPLSVSHEAHKPKDHARYKRSPFDPQQIVLAGFANIGRTTQSFTCAPGTHVVQASARDKPVEVYRRLHDELPDQPHPVRIPKAKDCERANSCDGGAVKIKIPPGLMVVYHTTLLVKLETSREATEATQHFKWVFGTLDANRSSVHAVESLKQPTSWPAYYPGDFSRSKRQEAVRRLEAYSQGFPKSWRVSTQYGSVLGPNEIAGGRIPPVVDRSLLELQSAYPEYGPAERQLYLKSRGPWHLGVLEGGFCARAVLSLDGVERTRYQTRKDPQRALRDEKSSPMFGTTGRKKASKKASKASSPDIQTVRAAPSRVQRTFSRARKLSLDEEAWNGSESRGGGSDGDGAQSIDDDEDRRSERWKEFNTEEAFGDPGSEPEEVFMFDDEDDEDDHQDIADDETRAETLSPRTPRSHTRPQTREDGSAEDHFILDDDLDEKRPVKKPALRPVARKARRRT